METHRQLTHDLIVVSGWQRHVQQSTDHERGVCRIVKTIQVPLCRLP